LASNDGWVAGVARAQGDRFPLRNRSALLRIFFKRDLYKCTSWQAIP